MKFTFLNFQIFHIKKKILRKRFLQVATLDTDYRIFISFSIQLLPNLSYIELSANHFEEKFAAPVKSMNNNLTSFLFKFYGNRTVSDK